MHRNWQNLNKNLVTANARLGTMKTALVGVTIQDQYLEYILGGVGRLVGWLSLVFMVSTIMLLIGEKAIYML